MNKKIKIAIINPHMKVGGIASSLKNWSSFFNTREDLEIDYYIFEKEIDDKYLDFIKECNVIFPLNADKFQLSKNSSKLKSLYVKILYKIGILGHLKTKYTLNYKVSKKYDIAISYSNDIPRFNINLMSNDFVINSIRADYKVAWVHNDIDKLGFTREYIKKTYTNFDYIVNVSEACKKQFDLLVPEYINKSIVIGNPLDKEYLIKQSELIADTHFRDGVLNFVTVARIHNEQKRIDRILDVVEKLKKDNLDFHWYIIGDGHDFDWLVRDSLKRKLDSHLTFLGFKTNPYPYMKNADYFVLTSDYEAQGMVLSEALMLRTPVISTNFEAAVEFIDEKKGYITNKNAEDIYKLIKHLISNNIKLNFKEFVYNNYKNQFNDLLLLLEIDD